MADGIDIKKVIQSSTSDMTLDSLSKKGVKQVKVLDQATIARLMSDAVDRVLAERSQHMTTAERDQIVEEARAQFKVDDLKKRLQTRNDEIAHKDQKLVELQTELETMRSKGSGDGGLAQVLTLLSAKLQQPSESGGSGMSKALEALTRKIENLPAGGGGGGGGAAPIPDEIALDFLINQADEIESNIDNVKLKQAQAGDVKGALAKLKKLQKGG